MLIHAITGMKFFKPNAVPEENTANKNNIDVLSRRGLSVCLKHCIATAHGCLQEDFVQEDTVHHSNLVFLVYDQAKNHFCVQLQTFNTGPAANMNVLAGSEANKANIGVVKIDGLV